MHQTPPAHARLDHARCVSTSNEKGRASILVSQLPSEILLMIFAYVAEHFFFAHKFKRNRIGWIRILHVCRRWYQLGVASPTLWCMATSTGGVECTQEILQRSRGLPLHFVRIPCIGPDTVDAAVLLLREAYRTRALHVHVPHQHRAEIVRAVTNGSGMPLLEALFVCIEGAIDPLFARLDEYFPIELPRLAKLVVHALGHVSGMVRAPNLVDLTIKPWEGAPDANWAIDADDLAQALRGMPHLTDLWIEGMRPYSERSTEPHIERVHLPALDCLSLSGSAFSMAEFVRLISVPTTAEITLRWFLKARDPNNAPYLVDAIKCLFVEQDASGRSKERRPRTISLDDTGDRYSLSIEASTIEDDAADFSLTLADSDGEGSAHAALAGIGRLVEKLPLSDVRSLYVSGNEARGVLVPHTIRPVVDGMAAMSRASFNISDKDASDAEVATLHNVFPRLERLRWSQVDWA